MQGPPGTGKTSTIMGMLSLFLENYGSSKKLLLCAPRFSHLFFRDVICSNAAIDEIAIRLLTKGLLAVKGSQLRNDKLQFLPNDPVSR